MVPWDELTPTMQGSGAQFAHLLPHGRFNFNYAALVRTPQLGLLRAQEALVTCEAESQNRSCVVAHMHPLCPSVTLSGLQSYVVRMCSYTLLRL